MYYWEQNQNKTLDYKDDYHNSLYFQESWNFWSNQSLKRPNVKKLTNIKVQQWKFKREREGRDWDIWQKGFAVNFLSHRTATLHRICWTKIVKMASLARLSRRCLTSSLTSYRHLASRALATAAAVKVTESSPPPAEKIIECPDRVKWDYRGQRQIIPLGQWLPKIAVDAYVAPNVVLAGQVNVLDGSSVWNGAVLRGDLNKITVGFCSNVQEKCVVHAAWSSPTGFSQNLISRDLNFRVLMDLCWI